MWIFLKISKNFVNWESSFFFWNLWGYRREFLIIWGLSGNKIVLSLETSLIVFSSSRSTSLVCLSSWLSKGVGLVDSYCLSPLISFPLLRVIALQWSLGLLLVSLGNFPPCWELIAIANYPSWTSKDFIRVIREKIYPS